ncbi:hypothetical protein AB0L99_25400 [Streptomyces sp. NPDC051954]|uniref:hypothetical protein n=1 Tax=unclassified Streptomyces TaxID=2593676 RepID=UPI003436162B
MSSESGQPHRIAILAGLILTPTGGSGPLGDVGAEEAGSAGGLLSAIQQSATVIGSAVLATASFHTLGGGRTAD